jgi:thiamine pyrophosphate-dependent acetolactate synthase large subunit-like protein
LLREAVLVVGLELRDVYAALHARDLHHWSPDGFTQPHCRVASISQWELRTRGWLQDSPQRAVPLDLNIPADPRSALLMLTEECRKLLGTRSRDTVEARSKAVARRQQAMRQRWQQETERRWTERPIAVPRLAAEVWNAINGEDWVLANGGLQGWTRRLWTYDKPYRWLGGSGGGGLGYGMGATLGAALAHRGTGRLIVNTQPDGDLLYTASALWTAAHHRLPVLTVMFNNRTYYNSEHHAVDVATERDRSTETRGIGVWMKDPPVDFAKLAESQGWLGIGPIEDPEKIAPALKQAMHTIRHDGVPALVDVVTRER